MVRRTRLAEPVEAEAADQVPGRRDAAHPTIRTWCRGGRRVKRNPATLIPLQFRPRVAMRFDAPNSLLVSGLLDGGADIARRAVVVDVPIGKGHVVLFANNPMWRGETIGSYFLVFNTLLNYDSLDAGRTLDAR